MHDASYEHYEQSPRYGRGPEVFYGYCCDTRRMRMMDYADYMRNMRRAYSDMYGAMYRHAQGSVNSWMAAMPGSQQWWKHGDCGCGQSSHGLGGHPWSQQGCGCHGGYHEHDCHCSCCIRGADAVEYVHCGEQRLIPLLFENDTRRERDVKLELGGFTTAGGQDLGWQAGFSESAFTLPACGRHTVLLSVNVDCGKFGGGGGDAAGNRLPSVDECKVGYATVRAEGCSVRPLVVAVAVLPNDCGAHKAPCGCGCCN